MANSIEFLNDIIIDILREIGNIGAGNAATSLAKMLNKKIDMDVPQVKILEFKDVPSLIGGEENLVIGIYFNLEGDLTGSFMFLLDKESALALLNMMMPMEFTEFDEMCNSALKEIGNILSGAYISSLATLTKLQISISVPSISYDMAGAILSVPAIQFGMVSDNVLIVENEFFEDDKFDLIKGYFLLVPDLDSYDTLLKSLGV
ncbi:chemotaxis protein CheC [Clostridiaceae bacterium HSG29]|nr:chemotaxis protein CheC [Clostridiaceae bacterium HSG29]